jgi:hypothetical protein
MSAMIFIHFDGAIWLFRIIVPKAEWDPPNTKQSRHHRQVESPSGGLVAVAKHNHGIMDQCCYLSISHLD